MLRVLLLLAIMAGILDDWVEVEVYDVITELEFSPVPGDDSVTSRYIVKILENSLPRELDEIESIKINIILGSGYSITKVVDEWERVEVESASGEFRMKALQIVLVLNEWDFWDVEIFTAKAWYKLKKGKVKI